MNSRRKRPIIAAIASACALLVVVLAVVFVPRIVASQGQQQDFVEQAAAAQAQSSAAAADEGGSASSDGAQEAAAHDSESGSESNRVVSSEAFGGAHYEADVVLVSPKAGVSAEEVAEAVGATIADQGSDFVELQLDGTISVEDAVAALEEAELTEIAQPNFIYYTQDDPVALPSPQEAAALIAAPLATQASEDELGEPVEDYPNDPLLKDQEGLNQWGLKSIKAFQAWELMDERNVQDHAVTVAVIDEGFCADHGDLKANVVGKYDALSKQSGDLADISPRETSSHGTHVAGIVGAVTNNEKGVAGTTNNTAGLLLVRASNEGLSGGKAQFSTDVLCNTIDYIVAYSREHKDLNLRVINMSIGTKITEDAEVYDSTSHNIFLQNHISSALSEGIVTVCSGGNSGDDSPNYPGDFSNIVSAIGLKLVNGHELDGSESGDFESALSVCRDDSYSSYNKENTHGGTWGINGSNTFTKKISAPGTAIWSTAIPIQSGENHSTNNEDNWKIMKGTSMASPMVASVLAMEFAINPQLDAYQAVEKLRTTAQSICDAGDERYVGWGEVDAYEAVKAAQISIVGEDKLSVGNSTVLEVAGIEDLIGDPMTWTWDSSNESVVSVDSSGTIIAKNPGDAIVSVGNESFSASMEVHVFDASIEGAVEILLGSHGKYSVKMKDNAIGGRWKWESSNEGVVSIDDSEEYNEGATRTSVEAKAIGTATLTATLEGSPAVCATREIEVVAGELTDDSVSLDRSFEPIIYDGKPHSPEIYGVYFMGRLLSSGFYTVELPSDVINAGKKTITIKGNSPYAGSAVGESCEYAIEPLGFETGVNNGSIVAVIDGTNRFTYDGARHIPGVKVTFSGTKLVENWDYTVDWDSIGGVNVGEYDITIKGKGNFQGETKVRYYIDAPPPSDDSETGSNASAGGNGSSGTSGSGSSSSGSGGSNSSGSGNSGANGNASNAGGASSGSNANSGSGSSSNATNAGTSSNGSKSNSSTSGSTASNGSKSSSSSSGSGSGSGANSNKASSNTGSSSSKSSGTSASSSSKTNGSSTAGTSSATGTASQRLDVASATVSKIANKAYTGKAIAPLPYIYLNGRTLWYGEDYTLSYKDNVKVGKATVTIKGIGSYKGTKTVAFKIVKAKNPMTAKAKSKGISVSAAKLKAKAQTVKKSKAFKVSRAKGKVTFKKLKGSKRVTVSKKTGKVTVRKGTKKGTYTVKVRVRAAGNSGYKAKSKTVTLKIRVK